MGGNNVKLSKSYTVLRSYPEAEINTFNIIKNIGVRRLHEIIATGPYAIATAGAGTNPFPEFEKTPKPGLLGEMNRREFNGDAEICCLNEYLFYWENSKTNEITLNPNLSVDILKSCPDNSFNLSSDLCDNTLYIECVIKLGSNKRCKEWFKKIQGRLSQITSDTNKKMESHCNNNFTNKNCDLWLSGLKQSNLPLLLELNDKIINSQSADIKKKYLECLFPPDFVSKQEKNTFHSLDCWYDKCVFTPYWMLTTQQIANRKMCSLNDCVISINEILTENINNIINMKCTSTSQLSPNEIKKKLKKEYRNNILFIPKNYISFLIIFIIVFFIFVLF